VKPLNDRELLQLWERGMPLHPLDRGLLALSAALPDVSLESLADWPLGRRNCALIELRCSCFGRLMRAWTACPRCAEKLEFELDGRVLLARAPRGESADRIEVGGLEFRLPTTRDVASILHSEADIDGAARQLAEHCRIRAASSGNAGTSSDSTRELGALENGALDGSALANIAVDDSARDGSALDGSGLDGIALDDIEAGMSLADPMAEILIQLSCPSCGVGQESVLDIVSFFWTELEAHAKRLLREVHDLATAYGWTEHGVLSLSDQRRAAYLDMVRA
jgi:hypothetical protein